MALNTGEFQFAAKDFVVPGRVFPIEIVRTYRSQGEFYSTYGYGWDLSYNLEIIKYPDENKLILRSGQCTALEYSETSPNIYQPPYGYFNYIEEFADGTCILYEKYGNTLLFDPEGRLTEIQDRTGNSSMMFTYDSERRIEKITNDVGDDVTFEYFSDRWTITDPAGRIWTYTYGPNDDLQTVTDPNGQVTIYYYNSHNLTQIKDANNQIWLVNTYNNDKVTTQRYGDSNYFHFAYYPASNKTIVTDRRDVETETIYDDIGLVLSEKTYTFDTKLRETDPDYYLTQYEYDSNKNMTRQVNPGGNRIKYEYGSSGNITAVIMEPNNGVEPNISMQLAYNQTYNFVERITDAKGKITTYDYNSYNGNLERITYPTVDIIDGNGTFVSTQPVIAFTYNTFGQVEKMTAPDGMVTKYEYYTDSLDPSSGRLKKVIVDYNSTNGLNITTNYRYDVYGNVVEVNDPNENLTQFAYNVLGKLTRITDSFNNKTNLFYDKNKLLSQIEKEIEGPNQITAYSYDILDNVKEVKDPLGYNTTYGNDKNENLSDVTDAEENNTHYEYDERNLLWKVTDA